MLNPNLVCKQISIRRRSSSSSSRCASSSSARRPLLLDVILLVFLQPEVFQRDRKARRLAAEHHDILDAVLEAALPHRRRYAHHDRVEHQPEGHAGRPHGHAPDPAEHLDGQDEYDEGEAHNDYVWRVVQRHRQAVDEGLQQGIHDLGAALDGCYDLALDNLEGCVWMQHVVVDELK